MILSSRTQVLQVYQLLKDQFTKFAGGETVLSDTGATIVSVSERQAQDEAKNPLTWMTSWQLHQSTEHLSNTEASLPSSLGLSAICRIAALLH